MALVTNACLPIPHSQRKSPAIEGSISRNGARSENVIVQLAVDPLIENGCDNVYQQTRTDENGKFVIEETKQFLPIMIYADRWEHWALCFEFLDGAKVIWSDGSWGEAPPSQRLTCRFEEELESSGSPLQIESSEDSFLQEKDKDVNSICQVENEYFK